MFSNIAFVQREMYISQVPDMVISSTESLHNYTFIDLKINMEFQFSQKR